MANDRYTGASRGSGFQPYSAGVKRYGASGRQAPNIGAVQDKSGYAERDRVAAARKRLALKRMQQSTARKTSMF